ISAEVIGIIEEAGQRYADRGGDYEPEHPPIKPRQHHPPIDQLIQVDAGKSAMQRFCHCTPSPPSTRPQAPLLKSMGPLFHQRSSRWRTSSGPPAKAGTGTSLHVAQEQN